MNRVVKKATSSKRGSRRASRAAGSGKKAIRASTAATKKRAAPKVAGKKTKKTPKKTATKARKVKSAGKVTRGASAKRAGATRDAGRVGRATKSTKRRATAGANKTKRKTKKAARNATAKKAIKKAGTVRVKTRKKRLGPTKASPAVTPSPTTQDPIPFFEETQRLPKTTLTAKQLDEFRQLLLNKRHELIGDVRHLQRDASRSGGEASPMPIHMADLGSDNWEHEFTLGLIENEQGRIRMIDGALARIADKTYGVCLATRKRIGVVRLRAKPWAKYCIEYARAWEEGRVP